MLSKTPRHISLVPMKKVKRISFQEMHFFSASNEILKSLTTNYYLLIYLYLFSYSFMFEPLVWLKIIIILCLVVSRSILQNLLQFVFHG